MPENQNNKVNQEVIEKQQFNCESLNVDYAITYGNRSFFHHCTLSVMKMIWRYC